MHTNWRSEVASQVKGCTFLWPHKAPNHNDHDGGDPDLYFPRDITLLRSADMVFCVIEDMGRNLGTATEIGMAYAWGKPIILVNLCSHIHSFQFLEKASTTVCHSLDRGLKVLNFAVSAEGAVAQQPSNSPE
jgi:nucleoside 2-deoxyribosyltransferase